MDDFALLWNEINPAGFFEKNNQEKQDIFIAIALFSKHDGKSGRNGKSVKYIFRKKFPHSRITFL